jgi:hypothetical protein
VIEQKMCHEVFSRHTTATMIKNLILRLIRFLVPVLSEKITLLVVAG